MNFSIEDVTHEYFNDDIEENKLMSILCYLSILWLVPMLLNKQSPYLKFHQNQGVVLMIISMIQSAFSFLISLITRLTGIAIISNIGTAVISLISLIILAVTIISIINVCNGKAIKLPILSSITFIR